MWTVALIKFNLQIKFITDASGKDSKHVKFDFSYTPGDLLHSAPLVCYRCYMCAFHRLKRVYMDIFEHDIPQANQSLSEVFCYCHSFALQQCSNGLWLFYTCSFGCGCSSMRKKRRAKNKEKLTSVASLKQKEKCCRLHNLHEEELLVLTVIGMELARMLQIRS